MCTVDSDVLLNLAFKDMPAFEHKARHKATVTVAMIDLKYTQSIINLKLMCMTFNSLKTKRRLLYLNTQFVPRSKHFSSRL